jgi:DNA-binding transcriptional LysR family regulator
MPPLDDTPLRGAEFRRSHEPPRPIANGGGSMDWDDVRVFLAVARHGSLRAAGRALGLSQPTIGRRLATFETTFGGGQLVPSAESVERAALMLERRRAAASPELSGTVRVSVGEWAAGFLSRCLSDAGPTALPAGITLELVESRQTANLARREADLAVRHHPPESGDLYVSKVGTFAGAVYRRHGSASDAWVTYTEEQAHYATARWVQQQIEKTDGAVALRASNVTMQLAAIRAGSGKGVLPCYAADDDPLLERVTEPVPEIAAEYSVIVHRDLRRAVCVRTVIDWVRCAFAEHRDALAGNR